MKHHPTDTRQRKTLRWVARVWSVFALLLALGMLVTSGLEARNEPLPLLFWILLTLWCAAVLGLLVAWRWELVGGMIALAAMVVRELVYFSHSGQAFVNFWMVWLPILMPAMLFILVWRLGRPAWWEKSGE